MIQIYRTKDYEDMSRKAAELLAAQVITKPDCVLGLATGSTPVGLYRKLVQWYEAGILDFSGITTVNLDEYKGLSGDNGQSYRYFMDHNLFDHINVKKERTFLPDGTGTDSSEVCRAYNKVISSLGGIDLQLLGLGHNGHIGFNEPGTVFQKDTHCVQLSERTIRANTRFFESEEDVPRYAYTMGIRTIMQARRIVVVVAGADKAKIVRRAFFGDITPEVPASVLQLHRDVIVVADEAALAMCDGAAE